MIFDSVLWKCQLACNIVSHHFVVVRFGPDKVRSIVAISTSQDKLVVYEAQQELNRANKSPMRSDNGQTRHESVDLSEYASFYYVNIKDIVRCLGARYIDRNRDLLLIGCVSSLMVYDPISRSKLVSVNTSCPIEAIATTYSGPSFTSDTDSEQVDYGQTGQHLVNNNHDNLLIVCAGQEKLFTIQLNLRPGESWTHETFEQGEQQQQQQQQHDQEFDIFKLPIGLIGTSQSCLAELTSERSSPDSIRFLVQGEFGAFAIGQHQELDHHQQQQQQQQHQHHHHHHQQQQQQQQPEQVVVSAGQSNVDGQAKMRLWPLDCFDQNLLASRAWIDESAPVKCLLAITTAGRGKKTSDAQIQESHRYMHPRQTSQAEHQINLKQGSKYQATLPSIANGSDLKSSSSSKIMASNDKVQCEIEQMDHFAFGLKNNCIGVHRIIVRDNELAQLAPIVSGLAKSNTNESHRTYHLERLWALKCRCEPVAMCMFDANNDGQDELVIGFLNGRLEIRAPFTGQLMGVTRCFPGSNIHLAGLVILDSSTGRPSLVAISTNFHLVAYRSSSQEYRVREPLRSYHGASKAGIKSKENTGFGGKFFKGSFDSSSDNLQSTTIETTQDFTATIHSGHNREIHYNNYEKQTHKSDSAPSATDVRQSIDLLTRLNRLRMQQYQIHKQLGHLIRNNLERELKFMSNELRLRHQWHFDLEQCLIKLILMVEFPLERQVSMIKIEDQRHTLFADGIRLINTCRSKIVDWQATTTTNSTRSDQSSSGQKQDPHNHVDDHANHQQEQQAHLSWLNARILSVVIPIKAPCKDQSTLLKVSVFSQSLSESMSMSLKQNPQEKTQVSLGASTRASPSLSSRMSQVCSINIPVPKYSLQLALPEGHTLNTSMPSGNTNALHRKIAPIRLLYEVSDFDETIAKLKIWAQTNFLCLQSDYIESNFNLNHPIQNGNKDIKSLNSNSRSTHDPSPISSLINSSKRKMISISESNRGDKPNELFFLQFIDVRQSIRCNQSSPETKTQDSITFDYDSPDALCLTTVSLTDRGLEIEAYDSGLIEDLLNDLNLSNSMPLIYEFGHLLTDLEQLVQTEVQLDESQKRVQSELYESVDFTRQLMEQLELAIELDEFLPTSSATAKDLVNELDIFQNSALNAAHSHRLNESNRSQSKKKIEQIKRTMSKLIGKLDDI